MIQNLAWFVNVETVHGLKATNISVFNTMVYVTVVTRLDTIDMVKLVIVSMTNMKRNVQIHLIQIHFVLVQNI